MAPRTDKDARFRGSGSVANPFAADYENGSDKASGAVGTIFAASLLRTSSILLRRSHADGQCVDAEWMATIRTFEHDNYGNVNHSENFLKERGQERRARKTQISSGSNSTCVTNLAVGSEPAGADLVGRDLIHLTSRSSDKTVGETDRVRPTDSQTGPSICPPEIGPQKAR